MIVLNQTFNAEPINPSKPVPAGWIASTMPGMFMGTFSVANDPDSSPVRQRVVKIELTGGGGSVECGRPIAVPKSDMRFSFWIRRETTVNGEYTVAILDTNSVYVGRLSLQNDGKMYVTYGAAGASAMIMPYVASTWYHIEWCFHADKTYTLWINGTQILTEWAWENDTTTSGLIAEISVASTPGPPFYDDAYFDDLIITAYDAEIAAPERLTIAANFESDITTAMLSTRKPDGSLGDEYSGDYVAKNAQEDSLGAPWRTLDAANGYHTWTLNYSTTPPYSRTMQLIAILGHNLKNIIGTFRLTLRAKSSPSTSWLTPDFEIDLSAKKADAMILAWLPANTTGTYWQLALYAGGVSGVSWFEIGRIIMTSFFVPAHNMEADYNLTRVDPSLTSDTEGGTRISRIKKSYRKLTIPLADMELSDQILLDALYAEAGAHAPWLVVLEPLADPIGKSIYGYIAPELSLDRTLLDYGTTSLELKEIVL